LLERRNLGLGGFKVAAKLLFPTEGGSPRARPYPHAVLCNALELDYPRRHQTGKILGQQPIQRSLALAAKVRQGVVIHLNATTDPAVGVMLLRQPCQLARTAHTLQRRIQPQGVKHLRGNRRPPNAPLHRLDVRI